MSDKGKLILKELNLNPEEIEDRYSEIVYSA